MVWYIIQRGQRWCDVHMHFTFCSSTLRFSPVTTPQRCCHKRGIKAVLPIKRARRSFALCFPAIVPYTSTSDHVSPTNTMTQQAPESRPPEQVRSPHIPSLQLSHDTTCILMSTPFISNSLHLTAISRRAVSPLLLPRRPRGRSTRSALALGARSARSASLFCRCVVECGGV